MRDEDLEAALRAMGYTPKQIQKGLRFSNLESAIEYISSTDSYPDSDEERRKRPSLTLPFTHDFTHRLPLYDINRPGPIKEKNDRDFMMVDDDLEKAIQASMAEAEKMGVDVNVDIHPSERGRIHGMPVGLKNVGNSCYVNSMLQSYFTILQFRDEILSLPFFEDVPANDQRKLCHELQKLFAGLILSQRKFLDPTNVIQGIVDAEGNQIHVGHQEDPTEFTILFFDRLKESIDAITKHEEKLEDEEKGNLRISVQDAEPQPQSFLQKLLISRQIQKFFSHEADGEKVELSHKEELMHIILNISYGDLYSSLDSDYTTSTLIDVFKTPKEHTTTAEKLTLFTEVSKVLTFQLQRVGFDAQKKSAVKNHARFEFPKKIYVDRYLEKNIDLSMKKRKEIQDLKDKQQRIQSDLDRLQNYNNTGHSIDTILSATSTFLQNINDPIIQNGTFLSRVNACKLYEQQNVEKYKTQIQDSQLLIENMYVDMNEELYNLHAVMVHDGEAGSGHYWAYIYHSGRQSWYQFNDIKVTEIDEDTVWKYSFGHKTASAYCLIYLHHSLCNDEGLSSLTSLDKISYPRIPIPLQTEIEQDNVEFIKNELEKI